MMPTRRPLMTASRFGLVSLAMSLALAACIPPPEPTPTPAPAPASSPIPKPAPLPVVQAPPPSFAGHWMDAPVTPGDWRYFAAGDGSSARFNSPEGLEFLAINCRPREKVVQIEMLGAPRVPVSVRPVSPAVVVRTETTEQALPLILIVAERASGSFVGAAVATTDPILDAMAFSKGRFAIETHGYAPLYLPSWPEVTRVIEDCR